MALLRCNVFSESLSLSTAMTVLLPQRTTTQIGLAGAVRDGAPPVLYLLHGLSDDDTTWLRRTSIERYVAPLGLAVVMPQVHRSFYTDEAYGGRYWTFLSEELPELVGSLFRVSDRREDTFVAGLSMGGYGALKWALRHPDRFAAAGTADDLLHLVDAADPATLPALHVSCGTEDELLSDSRLFVDRCTAAGVPVTTSFGPGDHDWAYWDDRIQDVLAWLPLRPPATSA